MCDFIERGYSIVKDISQHVLDIASNSVRAKSKNINIRLEEKTKENQLIFFIEDDGSGIADEILKDIKNPFTTSRKLRNVGLGIPLLNDNCLLTGGSLNISSALGEGTKLTAIMGYDNIDRPPLGDMASTISGLISSNEKINIKYTHIYDEDSFSISTVELKDVLGEVSLNEIEIIKWLREYLKENEEELRGKTKK